MGKLATTVTTRCSSKSLDPSYRPMQNQGLSIKKQLTFGEIYQQFQGLGVQKLLGSTSFLAVNLYSKSIFGEDILANVSIEQIRDAEGNMSKITGSVRIRSRSQGIALSLGDRITVIQRK